MKSSSVTIQMKATEQYFPVVLFIMLYKMILTSSLWIKSSSVTIQVKAIEQYFPVVLFIMLNKAGLSFDWVGKIPKCDIQVKATFRRCRFLRSTRWF